MKFFRGAFFAICIVLIIAAILVIIFTLIYGYSAEVRSGIISGLIVFGVVGGGMLAGLYSEWKQPQSLDPWMRANIEWKEEYSDRAAKAFGRDTVQYKAHRELWLAARRDEYTKRYAEGNRRTI